MTAQTVPKIFTRDFILVFFAQFTFIIVCHILIPTLPIYLSKLGSGETEIGVLIGSFGVSSLVFRPFVGRALLKIPERRFMIIGALLFALTSAAYLFAPPFWPFLMVRIIQGIGLAFFNTAAFTLIANISPETHRGQSLSYFFLAQNISLALAPVMGMLLINHFSFALLFWVCLGVSLSSLFITHKLEKRQIPPVEDSPHEGGLFLNGKALPTSIVSFCFYFIWGGMTTFFPLYAIMNGVANPGLFFTALSILLILSRVLGGRILDLYSKEKVILYFFSICVLSVTVLALSRTLPMFILAGVIWGVGAGLFNPAIMAYTLDRAGSSSRGPAMGTYTAFSDLGVSLGPATMGIIIPFTGYQAMFLCLALVGVFNLAYFHLFVRKG
jgi:MFS family permease